MSSAARLVSADRAVQSVGSLQALLALRMSRAPFVALACSVVAVPPEPTVAAQKLAAPPIADAPLPGG